MREVTIAATAALLLALPTHAKQPECTSMCHLFDAYALSRVCPNFTLNAQYASAYKDLFAGSRSAQRFKADSMTGVLDRISRAVNVCAPACLKLEIADGTACQYLTSRPIVPDDN
jgi:hypothetical protein